MTVLQWIVQLLHPIWATGWTTASAASDGAGDIASDTYCAAESSVRMVRSGANTNGEMSEQEHQADERDHSDDQRPGKKRAEQTRIVLEVHVEQYDDCEFHRRHDKQEDR